MTAMPVSSPRAGASPVERDSRSETERREERAGREERQDDDNGGDDGILYAVAPPQISFPRVLPQL